MEVPGFMILVYIMNTLPATLGIEKLPLENKVLGGMFVRISTQDIDRI